MINKSLVKQRFLKNITTYDENAFIQKIMAKKLISMVKKYSNSYCSVFETGCLTGILTREIKHNINYKYFFANDIVNESESYIKGIDSGIKFIPGDIEKISLPQSFDLIISNASLQWCDNLNAALIKLVNSLNDNALLAVSLFNSANLKEIKQIFNLKDNIQDIKNLVSDFNVIDYFEEEMSYNFNSPLEILRHLKYTGVNSIKEMKFTKSSLKNFEENYIKLFNAPVLTYNPVYIIIKKF